MNTESNEMTKDNSTVAFTFEANKELLIGKLKEKVVYKKVMVYSNVFCLLDKIANECLNIKLSSEKTTKQGAIFGYEDDKNLEISNLYPLYPLTNQTFDPSKENELPSIANHLEHSRMDFTPLGLYLVSEHFNINHVILRYLLKLTIMNPQSVLLHYNPLTKQTYIKRLTNIVIDLHYQADMKNYQEYEINLFNNQYSSDILEDVSFSEIQDMYSMLSCLKTKDLLNETDLNELNKNSNQYISNSNKSISNKL